MQEIARMIDQLQRAYDGDAWYGPTLRGLLADVTAAEAAARPLAAVHTIWELTLHVSAWIETIRQRLQTGVAAQPAEGDWPAVPAGNDANPASPAGEAAWAAARGALEERHRQLVRDVAALDPSRLEERIGLLYDAPTGAGVTVYVTLHGLVQHNVYHSGQIALLKKALRSA
jgi:uncharacterized damage-inducible protein DinB